MHVHTFGVRALCASGYNMYTLRVCCCGGELRRVPVLLYLGALCCPSLHREIVSILIWPQPAPEGAAHHPERAPE